MSAPSQQGSVLTMALVFLGVLVLIMTAGLGLITRQFSAVSRQTQAEQAFALADAGTEHARWLLGTAACTPAELTAQSPLAYQVTDPDDGHQVGTYELQFANTDQQLTVTSLGRPTGNPNQCQKVQLSFKQPVPPPAHAFDATPESPGCTAPIPAEYSPTGWAWLIAKDPTSCVSLPWTQSDHDYIIDNPDSVTKVELSWTSNYKTCEAATFVVPAPLYENWSVPFGAIIVDKNTGATRAAPGAPWSNRSPIFNGHRATNWDGEKPPSGAEVVELAPPLANGTPTYTIFNILCGSAAKNLRNRASPLDMTYSVDDADGRYDIADLIVPSGPTGSSSPLPDVSIPDIFVQTWQHRFFDNECGTPAPLKAAACETTTP